MLGRTLLVLALLAAAPTQAQTYKPPRNAYGQPDLQGLWDNDSQTPLQRPKAFTTLVATPEAAAEYEKKGKDRYAKVIAPVNPDEPAPADGKVEDDDRFEAPAGMMRIRGEIRTSQIVEPADGRLPYTLGGRTAAEKALRDEEVYDHPEGRPFDERCLLGGGGGVAPPIIARTFLTVVQTREHVLLLGEDNHEARIVRLGGKHAPDALAPWMGDPVGRWEGDTLVVETRNRHPNDRWRWSGGDWIIVTPAARIVERFRRISSTELLYSYVVEDDVGAYTQPWRGEVLFRASKARLFENACHEGNYALGNILAGGRAKDREARIGAGQAAP